MRIVPILSVYLLVTLALASPASAQDGPRPMTVDDALDMIQVGNALISPDGSWVLYSRRELNWEDNKYETKYWRVSSEGGEAFQYVGEDGGSAFQFSPDGSYLTFRRAVEEKQQIFWMRTVGGEALQLTKHASSVGTYRWSKDGSKIFFSAQNTRSEEEEKEGT